TPVPGFPVKQTKSKLRRSISSIVSTVACLPKAISKRDSVISAGKMHGAGVVGPIIDLKTVEAFIDAGADVILVPAVGTVPGFD
ncbi:hypothetical protein PT077_09025, partial [Erysipelothrix rhusiopathiae]|nr:hypothetical protein [Erysipelothrix rhusiopathiae]